MSIECGIVAATRRASCSTKGRAARTRGCSVPIEGRISKSSVPSREGNGDTKRVEALSTGLTDTVACALNCSKCTPYRHASAQNLHAVACPAVVGFVNCLTGFRHRVANDLTTTITELASGSSRELVTGGSPVVPRRVMLCFGCLPCRKRGC